MTYQQAYQGALDTNWRQRVAASLVASAIAIAVDAPGAGIDTRRNVLARAILRAPDSWAATFALGIAMGFLAEADLSAANVTDAEIDTRVSAVFNDYLDP